MRTDKIRGRVAIAVETPDGPMMIRRAHNLVLRKGAGIIANLVAGVPGSKSINQVQVGFATEAATAELTALTPPPVDVPIAALRSPLTPDNFTIATDKPDNIQVSITAVFKPTVDLAAVSEAGLLADEDLYNQVVFEPIDMKAGQDITFFWEIDLPFGH